MKIAYITTTLFPSEKANAIQSIEMARTLCDEGIDVDFFCPKSDRHQSDHDVISNIKRFFGRDLSLRFFFCNPVSVCGRFSNLLTIPKLIMSTFSNGDYDYYFVRNNYLFVALVYSRKPVIFEEHQWNFYRNGFLNSVIRWCTIRASKRYNCKLFVCISEELEKRWLSKGISPAKSLTAHDAVDLGPFTPPLTRQEARKVLGLPEKGVIVSYVGSLYGNRAIDDVLAAARRIESATFRFVGGPEKERHRLEALITTEGPRNVEFVRRVDRPLVPLQLFASDVLLFTMNERTMTFDICSPMKIFEYMAAGRIIVAPDLPSIREVLQPPYAYLYRFPDADALAAKIGEAVATVRAGEAGSRGLEGRKVVENQYTWRLRAESILSALCGKGAWPCL